MNEGHMDSTKTRIAKLLKVDNIILIVDYNVMLMIYKIWKEKCKAHILTMSECIHLNQSMHLTFYVTPTFACMSFEHMSFWCLFLDLHLTMHHSNLGFQLSPLLD